MSGRTKGFVVSLTQEASDEFSDRIKAAIQMVSGVASVEPVESTADDWMNRDMIRRELEAKLWKALK